MSQLIYRGQIKTKVGLGEVRIRDTAPTQQTPDLRTKAPLGGVRLEMGDRGQADDNLPTSIGSFFDLRFPDTPQRDFQELFGQVFDESRFDVELEIPSVGTWRGAVKSTLQSRPVSRRTRERQVQITCYDRLAALGGVDSALDAFKYTVTDFLEIAFGQANADLDIILYVDQEATDINGTTAEADRLIPVPETANNYKAKTGDPEGLEGDTLRDQLDSLCQTFLAAAYQDVREEAWAFMDVASIGASVNALRYDGTTWSSYTVPEHSIVVDELLDDGEADLDAMPSTREVCLSVSNLSIDPWHEQYTGLGPGETAYHWNGSYDGIGELGVFSEGGDSFLNHDISAHSQTIDVDFLVGEVDKLRLYWESQGGGDFEGKIEVTYGDGTTDNVVVSSTRKKVDGSGVDGETGNPLHEVFYELDDTKERVTSIYIQVQHLGGSGGNVVHTNLEPIIERDVTGPDGGSVRKVIRVEKLCFQAIGGSGRRSVDDEAGGALTDLSTGRASPQSWSSKKFDVTSSFLGLVRATYFLALQPPGYEKLKARIDATYAPLGTRLQWTKPGEKARSTFIPLKGRTLYLQEEMDAGTSVKDVEIPDAVVDLVG